MTIDIDEKKLLAWKESFAESGINYETDDEYKEAIYNLVGYFDVLIQIDLAQKQKSQNNTIQKS